MTPKAEAFAGDFTRWAATRPDLIFAMVLGSQARASEPADEFSDLDLVLGCSDTSTYLDDAGWVAELGRPLLTFLEPTATGGEVERRVLFDNGLDVDFSVISMDKLRAMESNGVPEDISGVLARGMKILVDREGLGPRLAAQAHAMPARSALPSAEMFRERTDDFLYHCLWTARKAARGELFVALKCLDGFLRRYLFDLAHEHHAVSDLAAANGWYGPRMLERWAAPAVVDGLARTCAIHDRQSISAAVEAAMTLHARLGREVARAVGVDYPTAAQSRVRELIAEIPG